MVINLSNNEGHHKYNPDMIIFGGYLNTDIDRNKSHSIFLKLNLKAANKLYINIWQC